MSGRGSKWSDAIFSESGWIKRSSRHPREITPLRFLCDHQSHCYISMWLKYDPKTPANMSKRCVWYMVPKLVVSQGKKLIETEKLWFRLAPFQRRLLYFPTGNSLSQFPPWPWATKWSHWGAGQDLHIFRGAPTRFVRQKISMGGDWYEKVMKEVMFMFKVKCTSTENFGM